MINHHNLFRSAEIDGTAAPGYSSAQGIKSMEELAKQNMLQGMAFSWTGLALEEVEGGGKAMIIFGLGLLVVYLTLSAQYESFALPFIILLAVPMAVLGALVFVSVRGLVDDVYVQIGLAMLIGLSAKNSILIVEFAEQLIDQGRSVVNAAIEAAELRLRPILMTLVAFILGVLPLDISPPALGVQNMGGPPGRNRHCWRYVVLHRPQPFLHPSLIRDCQRFLVSLSSKKVQVEPKTPRTVPVTTPATAA